MKTIEKHKTIPRIYNSSFKKFLENKLITVLTGPRQSGKTTSINAFLEDIPSDRKICINLDSSFERDRIKNSENYLQGKIEETLGFNLDLLKDKFYLFVDEAQKLPAVFESIKILYDKYEKYLKIIISGSSSLELLDKTAETLAGRVQVLRVSPFSMSEASLFEEIDDFRCADSLYRHIFSGEINEKYLSGLVNEFKSKSNKKTRLIEKLILRSLFPPTFTKIEEEAIPHWLADYIDTYMEKDMRSVKNIGDIENYRKVIIQLSSRAGSLLEYHQLGLDAGVNQITTKKYVTIWQESLIGFLLPPFFLNISTRIKKSKKVYFFDNGLIWALSGFRDRKLIEAGSALGHYFENLVITDFIKWGFNIEKRPDFYFWEKSRAAEIDLVINTSGMTIPIEIKSAVKWDNKYLRAIDTFKEEHKEKKLNIPFSLIIYKGDFIMPREDVFAIPVWLLC